MPPHEGLVHPPEYNLKDSNVELINSALDHQVKYNSATTEPAWREPDTLGRAPGLHVWRIEQFEVVAWPKERYGEFYDGDSYIVLHSTKVDHADSSDEQEKEAGHEQQLHHDIYFWLGSKTTQDEAGTAAYKTVELDEYLHGAATQHREVQAHPSPEFVGLFPRLTVRAGGVRSGFRHVVATDGEKEEQRKTLLRVFKHPGSGRSGSVIVHEVEPDWRSLDDRDVFVLDATQKIWVWQGRRCSPMEKGKAAQVVHDLTQAKHVEVEVLSQLEARSKVVVDMLGGKEVEQLSFTCPRPLSSRKRAVAEEEEEDGEGEGESPRQRKLFRLSDAHGSLSFDLVKEGDRIGKSDLDGKDVFLFDAGDRLWVWQGLEASATERALWLRVTQRYVRWLQESPEGSAAHLIPISKVVQGHESPAFMRAIAAVA
ncbi:gelsolin/scinderin family protein [Aspergillus saccharolyticus JOP 1030-1]|uniref:Putative actin-binding protein Fragmin n=1 Tax=Aspergillus saccharolyticus JOP 1030-1 TaxID=1450539 RepID=A0A318ZDC5_9EURO|nr:putative actin-binding protein Fragmin [Aspergillus saccharolyticus JOP 1030-1]PYH44304.1 putative actin-binding protein Fragmin [Aspergillus saccharolyticus JOP 1030-1]